MTLGGAAQQDDYPECRLCGHRILGSPASLTVGTEGPQFFCADSHGCRRRAALRMGRMRAALERLANPAHVPKTEEAALLQIEVEQIARGGLE